MSVLIVELYDALKDAGASEEKARAAAKAVSDNDARLAKIEGQIEGLKGEMAGLKVRMDTLSWAVGINIAATVAVLLRLLIER